MEVHAYYIKHNVFSLFKDCQIKKNKVFTVCYNVVMCYGVVKR